LIDGAALHKKQNEQTQENGNAFKILQAHHFLDLN